MANAVKIKLNQLYRTKCAGEPSPDHYTPATVEVFSASSNVTIRATSNPEYSGGYADLPVCTTEAAEGEVWECDLTRSVRFLSFSCSDANAEIYVSGFRLEEVEEPEPEPEPESEPEEEPSENQGE